MSIRKSIRRRSDLSRRGSSRRGGDGGRRSFRRFMTAGTSLLDGRQASSWSAGCWDYQFAMVVPTSAVGRAGAVPGGPACGPPPLRLPPRRRVRCGPRPRKLPRRSHRTRATSPIRHRQGATRASRRGVVGSQAPARAHATQVGAGRGVRGGVHAARSFDKMGLVEPARENKRTAGRPTPARGRRDGGHRGRPRADRAGEPRPDRAGQGRPDGMGQGRSRGDQARPRRPRADAAGQGRRTDSAGQSRPDRAGQGRRSERGGAGGRLDGTGQGRPRPDRHEVLPREVLAELGETVRPHAFDEAAAVLAAAVVALSEEDAETAVRAARTAKGAAPRSAATREVLGIALYRAGDYRAARTELAAAPYGDLGQPAAGVALLRRHARWPTELADHHLRLAYAEGALAEQAGDTDGARRAFTRVVEADPSFYDAADRLQRLSTG